VLYLFRLTNRTRKETPLNPILEQPEQISLDLGHICGKPVEAAFTGGNQSTEAGLLLLQQTENNVGIVKAIGSVLFDPRDQRYIDHTYQNLLTQRVFQIAAGYEDANDSDTLRHDPILKLCANVLPETGAPLASQPTMSRFENSLSYKDLYRIAYAFAESFIASYDEEPRCIVLDFDDTEDRVHGHQQLALFNGYFDEYCFLPLHIYEGLSGKLVTTILKPGKRLTGKATLAIFSRLITLLRTHWNNTHIVFRADSHFASPEVMEWIETQENVFYVTGLTSNNVLVKMANKTLERAKKLVSRWQEEVVVFDSFYYAAGSWTEKQRVIVKVEFTPGHTDPNIRFIVTNAHDADAKVLYTEVYCARGEAELYIKDHKTYLKSDRTSCHRFEANQFRVFLHSAAYVLIHALQHTVLKATEFENATMQTIQLKILKLSARVRELKTRIKIEFPSSCPLQETFVQAFSFFTILRC
jgi:hypothetical protein